jgi:hypothetical protein
MVLHEGNALFGLRWTLPVVDDFDENSVPFEYYHENGEIPYKFMEIPGVHIPDICNRYYYYLALREIEKWAEGNMLRRNTKTSGNPDSTNRNAN